MPAHDEDRRILALARELSQSRRTAAVRFAEAIVRTMKGSTVTTDLASRVKNAMADRGVLIGTSARESNVLKIRPPLCITRDEARLIVDALDEVLD